MKHQLQRRLLLSLGLAMSIFQLPALAQATLSADEIMKRNFFASKVKALEKNVTLTLINQSGATRQRTIHAISALLPNGIDSNLLVRLVAPADVKGIGFLKQEHLDGEDDQWIFLPALHKSRRLVSNNKKDSFMGSDFSYGDVLPTKVSLYKHKLTGEEVVDGIPCYIVESIPVDDNVRRDYDYGKKVHWIAKSHFHEVKIDYYDLKDKLLKTQIIKGIILMDKENDRWAASVREMSNHQSKHKSTFVANSAKADITIPKDTFTLRNLEIE